MDPVRAAAYTLGWGYDRSGDMTAMPRFETTDEQVCSAVRPALFARLDATSGRAGFLVLTGSVVPREVDETSLLHTEMVLTPLPVRQDDGDHADAGEGPLGAC